MILIGDHFGEAARSLRSMKTRTALTSLGIAIGVASITAILSLSGGILQVIDKQIGALDQNIILVRPGAPSVTPQTALLTPINQQMYGTSSLTEQDAEAVRKVPGVASTAPLMIVSGSMTTKDSTVKNGMILATSPELETVAGLQVADGQFIDSVTDPNTAVIGPQLAVDLFGTERPIGQTFTMRGQLFTVIGALKRMNDPVNFNAVDFDNVAIINMEAGKNFHHGKSQIQQINARATSGENTAAVARSISNVLRKNHAGEMDYEVVSGGDIVRPTNELFIAVTGVMALIAAISLVVGGIGIMNIMLVGVAERTREIGLRKAIGASNRHIMEQFLAESLLISAAGGVLGYAGGYVISFVAGRFLNFTPSFEWQVAVVAFSTSIIVGGVFGLYPAIRAARKDPIESLRQYH